MTRPQRETRTAIWSFRRGRLQAPTRSVGGACAGLLLGGALAAGAAESVPAPPVSGDSTPVRSQEPEEPVPVIPLLMPPDTVKLLPPAEGGDETRTAMQRDAGTDVTESAEAAGTEPAAEPADSPALPQAIPMSPAPAADVPPTPRPSDPIVERAEMLQRDKELRYERLRGQLKDLIARWEEQQQRLREMQRTSGAPADSQAASAAPDMPGQTSTPDDLPSPPSPGGQTQPEAATREPAATDSSATLPPGASESAQDASSIPAQTGQEPWAGPEASRAASPGIPGMDGEFSVPVIAEGPIDRLGLADSLFATGEIELALELYQQLDADSERLEEHDRYWVSYQIGCCYRRLDNLDEAQKWYRGVVADKNAGWVGDLARWWLDHLEERSRLTAQVQGLQQAMQTLEQQVNEELSTTD